MSDHLNSNAGDEPLADRFKCGYIAAFNDLVHMELVDDNQEADID